MPKKQSNREYAGKPYAVGKGKPPKHSQFKPGQSGNPKGKPAMPKEIRDLIGTHAVEIVNAMAKKAKAGNARAAEVLLKRHTPALTSIEFKGEMKDKSAPPLILALQKLEQTISQDPGSTPEKKEEDTSNPPPAT
jgi:hypothetical protein